MDYSNSVLINDFKNFLTIIYSRALGALMLHVIRKFLLGDFSASLLNYRVLSYFAA